MNRLELHRTKEKALCYAWQYMPNSGIRTMQNIYHATVQKAGSLWVRRVFNDPRVKKITGLSTFPQYRYEWDEFHKSFPVYSFIPGLYISYDLYEEIEKPEKYKTFFVMRDPRDIVVSWYYSMLKTHILMGKVGKYRNVLQSTNYDDGIIYCIKTLALKFAGMRTWMYNQDDSKVLIIKFEELTENPVAGFKKIFHHCETDIPDTVLKRVLDDYTKSKLRENDLKKREDQTESHYRREKSTHKTGFTDKHLELFYAINGDLLNVLGYEN